MILSKRERTIVVLTIVALGLFIGDRILLSPLFDRWDQIEAETSQCLGQIQKADNLFSQKRKLVPRFREMNEAGLGMGAAAAEIRLHRAIQDWAQEADLTLSSVKLERTEMERQFQKITWRVSATGNMTAVSRFLWRIEKATLPVRISDLQMASRQEGTDALTIQVGVATLCMPAKAPAKGEKAPGENGKGSLREEKA